MTALVNLLAWREQRLALRLRLWLIALGGASCVVLFVVACRSAANEQHAQQQRLIFDNARDTLHRAEQLAASAREQEQRLASQQETVRQAQWRQAQTQRWSNALLTLAQALPPQTWLNTVEVHGDVMRVDGLSRDEVGVHALHTHQPSAGLRLIQQGALKRERSGKWRFSLTFSAGGVDVATP
ncbi:hypothetical protein GWD52_03315 [Enterobacteriaceae bacterium 4M9]|nr:hypothetical protein [Enterobacteriaceae bacterium 4M9]